MKSKSVLLRGHFAISRASQLKRHLATTDECLLKNAKPEQQKHDIRCHRLQTATLLHPVAASTTAKELTATDETYSVNGLSLSPEQFASLRNNF